MMMTRLRRMGLGRPALGGNRGRRMAEARPCQLGNQRAVEAQNMQRPQHGQQRTRHTAMAQARQLEAASICRQLVVRASVRRLNSNRCWFWRVSKPAANKRKTKSET